MTYIHLHIYFKKKILLIITKQEVKFVIILLMKS